MKTDSPAKPRTRTRRKTLEKLNEAVLPGISCPDQTTITPYDENLLERARTQWQFGDWQSLAQLHRDTLQHHPDRAKLTLLAAAGKLQLGQTGEAMRYIRLANDWGADRKLICRILISGVYNSMGRAAAIGNEQRRALQYFESAIAIGTPSSAKELVANARARHELETMGLLLGSQGRLQQIQALAKLAGQPEPDTLCGAITPQLNPVSEAHNFYIKLGEIHEDKPIPFLLIDSKSLPRSGLHYLKNSLNGVFGEHFSFCEWYQEPGCCKEMPCALTGFADHARDTGQLRIRLAKSHDLELADPVYQTNTYLRRLVLVRDPLFILTSWFALSQLEAHKAVLANSGINVHKIWMAHEKEVLTPAYRLLNDNFKPPSLSQLADWLEKRSEYITGFVAKWVDPLLNQPERYTQVVRYEDLKRYVASLTNEYKAFVSNTTPQTIDKAVIQEGQQFNKREDPFVLPSENLTSYVRSNARLFIDAARSLSELESFGFKSQLQ